MTMVTQFLQGLGNWEIILFFFLIFLFLGSALVATIIIVGRLRWPFKIIIFQEIGDKLEIIKRDRARLITFGNGGEEIMRLKKMRKLRSAYGKRIGKNQIAWVIADDGLWYNVTLESFNKKSMEVGIYPVDRDVRMANASIRIKNESEFQDKNFMEKYGALIYGGMIFFVLLAFGGVMWFAFDKLGEVNSANLQSSENAITVAEVNLKTMEHIENTMKILEGRGVLKDDPQGSGLVPA